MENTIIDNADILYIKITEMRRAQSVFAEFAQEQEYKIFFKGNENKRELI